MTEELKPCPFCKGQAKLIDLVEYEVARICCTKCKAGVNAYRSRKEAIEAWNRRPDDDKG